MAVGEHLIRVAVVDDHPAFRDGIAALLAREPDIDVMALGGALAEARAIVDADDPPDVVILDVLLGEENGKRCWASAGDRRSSCVAKNVETRELIKAVRAAAAGQLVFDRRLDAPPPELTAREIEVVRLVADGLTNDEIGASLRCDRSDRRGAPRPGL